MPRSHVKIADDRRAGLLARDLLDRVGDRWSALVIYGLYERPMRFSELKDRVDEVGPKRLSRTEISHKMLAEALRGLTRDGLVARSLAPGAAARWRYALTPLGRSFWEPMMAVHDWTVRHLDAIESARRSFDAEATEGEEQALAGPALDAVDCGRPLDHIVRSGRRRAQGPGGTR